MVAVSFTPNDRIIEVTDAPPANNIQTLDFQLDVYSEAKRQWLSTPSLRKHRFPIKAIGGDPITDVQNLGTTFFLLDGWQIRAYNQSGHRLVVVGNISTQTLEGGFDADEQKFDFVSGVQVENQVSNIVDSSVARLDLAQLLEAVYIDVANGVSGTDEGIGVPTNPVNNITDARTIADRDNLSTFRFRGDITLHTDFVDFSFEGLSAEGSNTVNVNGYNVDDTKFQGCIVTGSMTGRIETLTCGLDNLTGFDGVARTCGFLSTITLAAGSNSVFHHCFSEIAGDSKPVVSLNAGGSPIIGVNVRDYSGGLSVENLNDASENISVELWGTLELAASCTAGTIVARGVGGVVDNRPNGHAVTFIDQIVKEDDIRVIRQLAEADEEISSTLARKLDKDTGDELLRKSVTGSNLTTTITLTEDTP